MMNAFVGSGAQVGVGARPLAVAPPVAGAARCNSAATMIKKLLAALVSAAAVATIAPATAHAGTGLLTVGMELNFKHHGCSLGFFATDSVGDQLAITAGHCAEGLHEKVFSTFGQQIGEVVAWQPDAKDGNGNLTGSRGFTVVYTYKIFRIQAFFTRAGTAKVGDRVRLYGARSTGTNGTITDVSYTPGHPDLDLVSSNVVLIPGDSGGPLYTAGPTLVGIASSVHTEAGGRDPIAQAQPLMSVEQEIKPVRRYGQGFSVYTQR